MDKKIYDLPKIDLHCHFDGSLSQEFVRSATAQHGLSYDSEALERMLVVSPDSPDLAHYLEKFDLPISCLSTPDEVRRGAHSMIKELCSDNIAYIEVRFSPALLAGEGMSSAAATEAAIEGLQMAKADFGIDSALIICAMRHHSHELNVAEYRLAREYLHQGVCAVDLAGPEVPFPTSGFAQLFMEAKRLELPFIIHAGECGSAQNIADAIELGARRIGHGIAMRGDFALQKLAAQKNVGIEMCPISNRHTKALPPNEVYPVGEFLQNGLAVTINTDNRTVSSTSIAKEFEFLAEHCSFTYEDCITVTKNAILQSFADDSVKHNLLKKLG